jgi:hypothetical protein
MGLRGWGAHTRRTVDEVKPRLRAEQRRVFRPWVVEPGCGCSGTGPKEHGSTGTARTCAARGWRGHGSGSCSVWDRTLPTIVACLDATLRRIGGVPTYALTDNEKAGQCRSRRSGRGAAPGDRGGGAELPVD